MTVLSLLHWHSITFGNFLEKESQILSGITQRDILLFLFSDHLLLQEEDSGNFIIGKLWIFDIANSYDRDSYWIMKGLLVCGMANTTRGMIHNLLDMIEIYGHVPNGGRIYYLNRRYL
jgi:hypothetical protein